LYTKVLQVAIYVAHYYIFSEFLIIGILDGLVYKRVIQANVGEEDKKGKRKEGNYFNLILR